MNVLVKKYKDFIDSLYINKMKKKLNETPKDEWLSIYETLNKWEFPVVFYKHIPLYVYDGTKKSHDRHYNIIRKIMESIEEEFSRKEILKFHNQIGGKYMSDSHFEYWYNNVRRSENSGEYYRRLFLFEDIEWWKDNVFEKLESCLL